MFTAREWSHLAELATILEPFADATDLTQDENIITINLVVPCILSLYNHIHDLVDTASVRFLGGLAKALKDSSMKRFRGAFVRAKMDISHKAIQDLPFNDMVYSQACMLDPNFGLKWVVMAGDSKKEEVKRDVRGSMLAINMDDQTATQNTLSEAGQPPPSKARRLFAYQSTSSQHCHLSRGIQCT